MNTTIDIDAISKNGEWTRRRLITEAILNASLGFDFEFEQHDITRACVGHVGNGFKNEEPTGEKEYIIRIKYPAKKGLSP